MKSKALWLSCANARPIRRPSKSSAPRKPRQRIRPRTTARAKEEAQYRKRVRVWLTEPGHQFCMVAIARLFDGEDVDQLSATQAHHKCGRKNKLLLFEPGWIPVSANGHDWIERNKARARELGLIGPVGTWNDYERAVWWMAGKSTIP